MVLLRTHSKALLTLLLCLSGAAQTQPLQKITISYPARTGNIWPFYIAKEGGYYQKYGLDVNLVFGVHPAGIAMIVSGEAAMTNYTMEQAMQATSRDGSMVLLASSFKKSLFSMVASSDIQTVKDLKGKRFGVSQIGDAPYNYAVYCLRNPASPREMSNGCLSARMSMAGPRRWSAIVLTLRCSRHRSISRSRRKAFEAWRISAISTIFLLQQSTCSSGRPSRLIPSFLS